MMGLAGVFSTLGYAAGPVITGRIHDLTGSYYNRVVVVHWSRDFLRARMPGMPSFRKRIERRNQPRRRVIRSTASFLTPRGAALIGHHEDCACREYRMGAVSGHRSGGIDFKRLIQGDEGAPDNFEFSFVRTAGDYYTPRHRHNFDQLRFCLEGSMNFAPGKDFKAGAVGIFSRGHFLRTATGHCRIDCAAASDGRRDGLRLHELSATQRRISASFRSRPFRQGRFYSRVPPMAAPAQRRLRGDLGIRQ